ncbi:hypothetical protein CRENPOLYSF2_410001 [Crenothrix polyspora]|uniref:Transposase IS200-like domain-containing protein n=1 Tax=Crenothrix polyspora TaxID=360316 RepID=A0A1R4HED9_9GAMM|nr:hypothetical protein CRENPOLYSF2_410001 [Crenothrix polyspora]
MDDKESLSHSKWDCKYHVVFIPKCRRHTLYKELRPHLGEVFRRLASQKESRIIEGHLMSDHVHMLISIPPKYSVAQVIGYIKGKSAIHLARVYGEKQRTMLDNIFGRVVILFQRLGGMKPLFGSTYATKNKKTIGLNN